MTYVIVEFVSGLAPCIAEQDLVLSVIAERECMPIDDLIVQTGPTIGSTTVWNARTEHVVAVYDTWRSLVHLI